MTGTSGSLTTGNANDLLFGFFHSDNGVTNTAGSGFTGRTFSGDGSPLAEDQYVTSIGSYSATMGFSGNADYVGFLVAFKAASSTCRYPSRSRDSHVYEPLDYQLDGELDELNGRNVL